MLSGISKLDLKRINRMQVLRAIWETGPISRVDLSHQLQITRASITQLTNTMIAEGLLLEIGEAPYQIRPDNKLPKGRKKILLDINANYKFVLGAIISEQEITVGLCTMHMEILDKSSMPCNDHTSRKEIIQFIISATERMMSNSCLTKENVLGIGVGVMPIMIGRMRVFYKNGILDFSELTKSLSDFPQMPPVFCGNAVWLQALANVDLQRNDMFNFNQVYVHMGSHIHIAVLRPEKSEQDYLTYSYLTERCIIRPNGRQQDSYPAGSVRAQLSVQAMQARIAEVYSKERTPFLYSATDGYIQHVTLEQMYQASSAGDVRCEEVVREIMQDWSVLLHNLVCCFQAQHVILHHFGLTEKGFANFKHYVKQFAGDDVAEKIVCSSIEDKTDFLAGCSLALMKNFYMTGGIPEKTSANLLKIKK
ncbi:MAG: MarR family winged helix-turn-helix transcriptional regulator [Oscillospiraceae bacterium]|nr:ROK family transcriptional regulator [Ruminococcus sp.]MDE6707765.1 MarR family winged helix-turn-helix transcriptional regulator [Oscillospiraceae bacterium]